MTNSTTNTENYTEIVARVMEIADVTWGNERHDYWQNPHEAFIVRFRGQLYQDHHSAQLELTLALRTSQISPIIRAEDGRHTILLVRDPLTTQVSQVFHIDETNWGKPDQPHVVVYRGHLTRDSIEAYDYLSETLSAKEITPLFREEDGKHTIVLMRGVNRPTKSNPMVNLVMFILTGLSVFWIGVQHTYQGPPGASTMEIVRSSLGGALAFAASLLAILLAHEFGHYLAGRYHKTAVTLPYFLPLPVWPFGTLGAFIQLKEAPKNKRILHDIGVAGPLAGFVVAIPVLLLGLKLSVIDELPLYILDGEFFSLEGNSILYLLAKYAVFGEWLPSPANYGLLSPFEHWVRFFFTGHPLPLGGRDVLIHPVAFAGWGGLLVTSLNLIPAGQLDGGHLMYVLLGRRTRQLLPFILVTLLVLGTVWNGWWLWAFLIFMLGRRHAEPLDQITPLDPRRKTIAILGLLVFIFVFTPVPLQLLIGPLV